MLGVKLQKYIPDLGDASAYLRLNINDPSAIPAAQIAYFFCRITQKKA
jgi:hypothetical protein